MLRHQVRTALVVSASFAAALACDDVRAQAPPAVAFERLDVNEDGVLSGLEMKAVVGRDTDGDGRVTRAEFDGDGPSRGGPTQGGTAADDAKLFAERDITEDGFLSGKEVKGFESLDADGDGEVTKDEFLKGREALRTSTPQPSAADAAGGVEAAKIRAEAMFLGLDANEDGRLSGTEFVAELKPYDADGDGRVTKAEFIAGELAGAATPKDVSAAAYALLVNGIRTGDVRPFYRVLREELSRDIDAQVFGWIMAALHDEYGDIGSVDKLTTKELTIAGRPAHEMIAEVSFAKGTDQGELAVTTLGGLVIGFRIRAPLAVRIDEVLYARLASDKTLAREVGEHFAQRGREVVDAMFAGKDEEAYGRFHASFREQVALEKMKEYFNDFRSRTGAVKSIEWSGVTCKFGEGGKPESRFSVDYDVEGANGKYEAHVRFQFVGYQGAIIGFGLDPVDE